MRTERGAPAATRSHGQRVQAPADPDASDEGDAIPALFEKPVPEVAFAPSSIPQGQMPPRGLPKKPKTRAEKRRGRFGTPFWPPGAPTKIAIAAAGSDP